MIKAFILFLQTGHTPVPKNTLVQIKRLIETYPQISLIFGETKQTYMHIIIKTIISLSSLLTAVFPAFSCWCNVIFRPPGGALSQGRHAQTQLGPSWLLFRGRIISSIVPRMQSETPKPRQQRGTSQPVNMAIRGASSHWTHPASTSSPAARTGPPSPPPPPPTTTGCLDRRVGSHACEETCLIWKPAQVGEEDAAR